MLAERHGATVAQLAIAWVLGRGEEIVPLVGARTRERLAEALGALELELDEAAIDGAGPGGACRRRGGGSLPGAADGDARQRALARSQAPTCRS